MVSLSICMPVFNAARYVGAAIDSILAQATPGVEIVIYDGGSTDDTQAVVEGYSHPSIRYHRASKRGGIDADLAACVALARGSYCWLFSGDDVMRPGALRAAARWMELGYDVYVCEHTLCDIEMRFRRAYPVLRPNNSLAVDLGDQALRKEWFERAVTTEAFFSFMSSLVVRRSTWMAGRLIPEFDGSCWAHVARLFERMQDGLLVAYVAEVWLDQRGGNDSFRGSGIVKRYALAIDGFGRLSERFFGRSSMEAFHVRRVLRFEFTIRMLLDAKLLCHERPEVEDRHLLDRLVGTLYADPSFLTAACKLLYRATPLWALRCARSVFGQSRRRPRP